MPWQRDSDEDGSPNADAPNDDAVHVAEPAVPAQSERDSARIDAEAASEPSDIVVPEPQGTAPTARAPEDDPEPIASSPLPVSPTPSETRPPRPTKPSRTANLPGSGKRERRARPGMRIGGVIVAILGVSGVIAAFANSNGDDTPSYELTAEEESELSAEVANTVLGYFEEISAGDAEMALSYADTDDIESTSGALLTDEMLAASQERAPIENVSVTNIELDPDYGFHATADAEYLLDGETTTTAVDLWESSSSVTGWSIRVDDRALTFSVPTFDGLQPVVYGSEVELDVRTPLFPGVYEIAFPDTPHLSLVEMPGIEAGTSIEDGADVAVVTHPLGDESYLELGVSRAGHDAYMAAVMAGIDACVASRDGESPCAQAGGSAGDSGAIDGTVTRHLDEELSDLDLEPRPLLDDPMKLRDIALIAVRYEATCAGGEECTGTEYFDYPVVDFGAGSPRVSWEGLNGP